MSKIEKSKKQLDRKFDDGKGQVLVNWKNEAGLAWWNTFNCGTSKWITLYVRSTVEGRNFGRDWLLSIGLCNSDPYSFLISKDGKISTVRMFDLMPLLRIHFGKRTADFIRRNVELSLFGQKWY